jgi:hypothetical protein
MVILSRIITEGQPLFLVMEGTPGRQLQEPTVFLEDLSSRCGGSSITIERACKASGVRVSGSRVFTVFMNPVAVEHIDELRISLQLTERKELPPMSNWWKGRRLSELVRKNELQVEMWAPERHSSGREDAPTKIGEIQNKRGEFHCYVYDGESAEAVFKRPTRTANTLKGFGVYLFEGDLYVPTVMGVALYMGIDLKLLEGLDKQSQSLALGNMVPTELVVSVVEPILQLMKKYPEMRYRSELSNMVEPHLVRFAQPSYRPQYPRQGHTVVQPYRGSDHPRLEAAAIGGAGSTLRGMCELGLYKATAIVTTEEAAARAVLGERVKVILPSAVEEVEKLKSAVVVGGLYELTTDTRALYAHVMRADWLVLQIRYYGELGSDTRRVVQWLNDLLAIKTKGGTERGMHECVMEVNTLQTGGYGDVSAAQVVVGTYTIGIIATKRGASKVAQGQDDSGSLISHLVSPSDVIGSSGRQMRIRAPAPQQKRGQEPLILGKGVGGRDVVDPEGPIAYPCTTSVAERRLEISSRLRKG